MSKGYTRALAITAPVAPATANPQGGMGASFDCPAIAMVMKKRFSKSCSKAWGAGVEQAAEVRMKEEFEVRRRFMAWRMEV
jgi:hypothetical protein